MTHQHLPSSISRGEVISRGMQCTEVYLERDFKFKDEAKNCPFFAEVDSSKGQRTASGEL